MAQGLLLVALRLPCRCYRVEREIVAVPLHWWSRVLGGGHAPLMGAWLV